MLSILTLGLLFLAGCSSVPREATPGYDSLIGDLSESPRQNRAARREFRALGKRAVPRLLLEIDQPASSLRSGELSLAPLRALRVLREIGTPQVLPVCRRLLIEEYIPPSNKQEAAILNEMLDAIYDHFDQREARDIFFEFITGDATRYVRNIRQPQHWAPTEYHPRVEVDVVRGIQLMVSAKDERAGTALTAFLRSIDVQSLKRTYFHRLAENGYAVTEATTSKGAEDLNRIVTRVPNQ